MKKKILPLLALACTCALSVSLFACNNDNTPEAEKAAAFVSMDINPKIELTLDKNDKVISVYGANEDAQVLLYGEESFIGLSVESAVEKITSLSVELGYINDGNKVIQTSVSGEIDTDVLKSKINAQITATAGSLNVNVNCSDIDAYSLLRKLEQLKAKYPENEKIQALTPAKFKLAVSAAETGEITIEAAVELDEEKLIQLVSDAHAKVKEYSTVAYEKAITIAEDAYDRALGAAMDGIYTTYYMTNHPLNAYYGLAYQGYKTSARGLNAVADALAFVEDMSKQPLDESCVAGIADLLDVDVDELKNSEGEITLESIEAYADKMFKNSAASEELENLKAELNGMLSSLESQVQNKIAELAQQYAPQIEALKTSLDAIIAALPSIDVIMPQLQAIKADLNEIANDLNEIVSDGKITAQEIRALANSLEVKSADALDKIQSDLTEEELDEIAEIQKTAMDALENAKTQMDNAIVQATQDAKDRLAELKQERKTN